MKKDIREIILREILSIDFNAIDIEARKWVDEYCTAGEYGLAYDTLLYENSMKKYKPSKESMNSLRKLEVLMEVEPGVWIE